MTEHEPGAPEASEALLELIFQALDHGIASIERGGPLIPFVLVDGGDGDRSLKRFMADELEAAQAAAREHLHGLPGAVRVALAYDGFLTVDGARSDAVITPLLSGARA